ncbi:pyruvate/oxaloacetate carboxyltransferase [Staphylothermus hellenicus]|uniref:Oxaloacetate decarboxylase alpha subunit n=1 Tax=Staphylothermus hellenicus (strain DSM 12710 / JCM 10830 / BK20S6-10-b1 / P8) TaxID=591019 RepID=D7DBP8_STAHD|nr:pyruvate/oxaloacetate carboxyltransferase [Staphylothermus hellenicus]ADI31595.1 oxaloacetate decarboxylase alpha subunit [Staphylothermus hellenicus DSM 12710]
MVKIIDTTLRDAHQSLLATRFRTRDILEIADLIDKAGFYSLEVWGGATFDAAIRFLREDPWERLRLIRENVKNTKLQMLLRGQNLVGYRHYPDDVVEKFVELAYKNGIDIFRVFDALNDPRNMKTSIRKAKEVGAIVQGAMCYTISPVHTIDYYLKFAEELLAMDVDMITIKDMAGILEPHKAYELVSALKKEFKVPVNVHTHATAGLAVATYLESVKAGADYIDTAISPLAFGTAQPGIQTIYYALPPDKRPSIRLDIIDKISKKLVKFIEEKYQHLLNWRILLPNPNVIIHQIPGGMFSNLIAQLREQNALDKLDAVLEEVPRVREELGWPPLVTPLSQIVGTQAVLNVLFGRYKVIPKETKNYVKGLYGRPPAPIKEEIKKLILGDEKPVTVRPADLLEPMLDKCRSVLVEKGYLEKEEDILTYCLFPETALEFFEARKRGEIEKPVVKEEKPRKVIKLYIDGQEYVVGVEGVNIDIIKSIAPIPTIAPVQPAGAPASSITTPASITGSETSYRGEPVKAPMAGKILKILVKPGDKVVKGDKVVVLESMKMSTDILAPTSGVVEKIMAKEGDDVEAGDILLTILPQ